MPQQAWRARNGTHRTALHAAHREPASEAGSSRSSLLHMLSSSSKDATAAYGASSIITSPGLKAFVATIPLNLPSIRAILTPSTGKRSSMFLSGGVCHMLLELMLRGAPRPTSPRRENLFSACEPGSFEHTIPYRTNVTRQYLCAASVCNGWRRWMRQRGHL
jgi:hypothetical protein